MNAVGKSRVRVLVLYYFTFGRSFIGRIVGGAFTFIPALGVTAAQAQVSYSRAAVTSSAEMKVKAPLQVDLL